MTDKKDNFIRIPKVSARTGIARSTIYALIKESKFPAPIRFSARISLWSDNSITEWIEEQKEAQKTSEVA